MIFHFEMPLSFGLAFTPTHTLVTVYIMSKVKPLSGAKIAVAEHKFLKILKQTDYHIDVFCDICSFVRVPFLEPNLTTLMTHKNYNRKKMVVSKNEADFISTC